MTLSVPRIGHFIATGIRLPNRNPRPVLYSIVVLSAIAVALCRLTHSDWFMHQMADSAIGSTEAEAALASANRISAAFFLLSFCLIAMSLGLATLCLLDQLRAKVKRPTRRGFDVIQ